MASGIVSLQSEIIACTRCPRLVQWREEIASTKVPRFREWDYWGRPVPGFGDPNARLLLIGLAPAAHGGNRTGRMFTGDRSGDWLYRALHKFGFANQPTSISSDDGLRLTDCYITASARCAPPGNKPTPQELLNCRPFLFREIAYLKRLRVIIALGKVGFDSAINVYRELGLSSFALRPHFAHGRVYELNNTLKLIASFHPSQQNTFTGRLTEKMFDAVFKQAQTILREKHKGGN